MDAEEAAGWVRTAAATRCKSCVVAGLTSEFEEKMGTGKVGAGLEHVLS